MKYNEVWIIISRNCWTLISIALSSAIAIAFVFFGAGETMWASSTVGLVGIIFLGIQHDFRKKEFEFSLFNERFAIFSQISEIVDKACQSLAVDPDDIQKLSGDFLSRSYYLFSDSTYQFIKQVRENCNALNRETPCEEAINFFLELSKIDCLSSKFPELKMNYKLKEVIKHRKVDCRLIFRRSLTYRLTVLLFLLVLPLGTQI